MGDAAAVDHAAAQCSMGQPPHEPREIADGIWSDLGAGSCGAQLAEDARDRRECGSVERVGAVGGHDRVEYQRLDVTRVVLRVLLGDLRSVGGAVQNELFVAAGHADRLDIGDAVSRRVEAARRSDLRCAFSDRPTR
jgi:hypothetical protein